MGNRPEALFSDDTLSNRSILLLAQIKDPAGTACLLLIELLAKRAPSLLRSGPGPDLPFLLVEEDTSTVLFTLYYLG
jgi:hypothetical protein